jgi:hypothetical protein
VQAAVADPTGPTTIRICAGIYPGTLTVGRDLALVGAGDGSGAGDTILVASPGASVVTINAGRTATLERLRITGGVAAQGGGINNQGGAVTLRQCTISGNVATGDSSGRAGGGIFNLGGTVTLDASHVTSNNTAPTISPLAGGGIYNRVSGTPAIMALQNGSTVTGNGSLTTEGGGILNESGCALTLHSGSLVSGNSASFGGGIENFGTLTLIDSDVTNNRALGQGGGIFNGIGITTLVEGSTVTGNTVDAPAPSGGGVFNTSNGRLSATGGSITGNAPDQCVQDTGATGCPP